jgi:hypothetical protein
MMENTKALYAAFKAKDPRFDLNYFENHHTNRNIIIVNLQCHHRKLIYDSVEQFLLSIKCLLLHYNSNYHFLYF